jgi:hypothetical protein
MKMGAGIKKYGVRVLFTLLAIIGIAFVKNSEISQQKNANVLAVCSGSDSSNCPDSGLDGSSTPKPKGPKCPCLTPRLPKG